VSSLMASTLVPVLATPITKGFLVVSASFYRLIPCGQTSKAGTREIAVLPTPPNLSAQHRRNIASPSLVLPKELFGPSGVNRF
jgi:hypothetical protein